MEDYYFNIWLGYLINIIVGFGVLFILWMTVLGKAKGSDVLQSIFGLLVKAITAIFTSIFNLIGVIINFIAPILLKFLTWIGTKLYQLFIILAKLFLLLLQGLWSLIVKLYYAII